MDARAYEAFVADVRERGIVVPLAISPSGMVLDGHHRLRAAAALGLSHVPVVVVDPEDEVEYLLLAALRRRHLSASQQAAIAVELALYREMRADGEARRLANLKQNRGGNAATSGKTRARIAELAGVSERTVQDAITVFEGDADLFAKVKGGGLAAAAAAERIRRRERDAGIAPAPPLPAGVYDVVMGDPPWQLGSTHTERAPNRHYPTMALAEIVALQVPAAKDAVLFLWAADGHLPDALQVMEAWGFTYVNSIIWVKDRMGLGAWVRNEHEQLLIGKRGNMSPPPPELRVPSVVQAPRRLHSEKAGRVLRPDRAHVSARHPAGTVRTQGPTGVDGVGKRGPQCLTPQRTRKSHCPSRMP